MKCPFCIKVCTKCKRILVAYKGNFYKSKTSKYGLYSWCKLCDNKAGRQYYQDNKEQCKQYNRQYSRQYYAANKELCKERMKQWKANNAEYHRQWWDKQLKANGLERGEGSYGEQLIRQALTSINIDFKEQYRFDDCKFKYTLPFDFYIPSINTVIEFDGQQHYEIVKIYGGLDKFIDTKITDTIKNIYCKQNNIKLIRIPYWEIDNIETIISGLAKC